MTDEPIFQLELAPVDEATAPLTYLLSISAQGKTIWPVLSAPEHPLEIQLDDLFSYLVEFWKPLLLRQTYPLGLSPARPSQLSVAVARRWDDMAQAQIDEEASEIDAFEEAHNLSCAFGGLFDLPSLWFVREGEQMLCDTGRVLERLAFDDVRNELTRVGDWIADHLAAQDHAKWDLVVGAWRCRDEASEISLVSWSASLEPNVAEHLIGEGLIEPPKSFAEAANDNDELLIAARMAGALPTSQIVEILALARTFEHHPAEQLDAMSKEAQARLQVLGATKPFNEGEALANFVREAAGIGPSERVDVFAIADWLGVEVLTQAVGPATFDGLAIAGPSYGPGAFINTNGRRIRENATDFHHDAGARVNLAHEICHLLVDREHALSAVDVLKSRMPAAIESRARAFAGELLLPGQAAAKMWDEAGSPTGLTELEIVLQNLADTFGVSFAVAAWKLEHGARWGLATGDPERWNQLKAALDMLAPYR